MKKKLVVFDLDGTLLNTLEDIRRAINYALSAYEIAPITLEEAREYVGNGLKNALLRAVKKSEKHIEEEDFLLMYQLLLSSYKKHPADNTRAYPGIENLLITLTSHSIGIAIASNKNGEIVREIIGKVLPSLNFSFILGQGDGYPLKPNAEGILKKIEECGCSKEDIIYVGDSEVDNLTALNLSSSYVIVNYGFRTKEELKKSGINESVSSVEELNKKLLEMIF